MSAYELLSKVNVNEHTEKKNGLTYLSWAWAWGELLKAFPDSTYTIYENKDGWNYHTDGRTCWVKTGVTVDDKEYIEYLPVMDFKNRSIPADQVTSFDVNKAIQRSLTKAVARHGLGLYIYAGEDLPEGEEPEPIKDKIETSPEDKEKEDVRRATIGVLMSANNLDNPGFNKLYKEYCLNTLKAPATIPISKLTNEQFDSMILAINEHLKKGAA
jgi:hypothetical protein